jgi:predicted ATPase
VHISLKEQNECSNMTEITIIEALEKLASLNKNGMQTIVKDDGNTLTTIEYTIYEIHDLAEAETEFIDYDKEFATRDYFVDNSSIRENNKDGRLIYRVVGA